VPQTKQRTAAPTPLPLALAKASHVYDELRLNRLQPPSTAQPHRHGTASHNHYARTASSPAMPPVRAPLLRIPFTDPLPAPTIIPASANSPAGAVAALVEFLSPALPAARHAHGRTATSNGPGKTLLLTGAGISVASGLADYRGTNGTYTLNKTYRPIYFHEFCTNHEARKRYWARSFLGWTTLDSARPNPAHEAVRKLGEMGVVGTVITQSMLPHLQSQDT